MQTLGEMVRTEKNLLKSPGFAKYVKKKEWENLKQIIVKYDMKFREQLKSEELKNMNRYSDETLKEIIREMKKVLPENWRILELLTFYFQLKQLEASEKSHAFY